MINGSVPLLCAFFFFPRVASRAIMSFGRPGFRHFRSAMPLVTTNNNPESSVYRKAGHRCRQQSRLMTTSSCCPTIAKKTCWYSSRPALTSTTATTRILRPTTQLVVQPMLLHTSTVHTGLCTFYYQSVDSPRNFSPLLMGEQIR